MIARIGRDKESTRHVKCSAYVGKGKNHQKAANWLGTWQAFVMSSPCTHVVVGKRELGHGVPCDPVSLHKRTLIGE